MDETKTVGSDNLSLYVKQQEGIAKMRMSLLSCDTNNPTSFKRAIQNVTVLRVYHQISRIIRYTDLMDKIEDKMYASIESMLDTMDIENDATWIRLVTLQEKLQKSMIESHKLLEPYLNFEELTTVSVVQDDPQDSFAAMILDQQSRDKVRSSAQAVLAALSGQSNPNPEEVVSSEEVTE